jgi:hypothetical protein
MSDIAIQVNNISKTFRIPHEKVSSLRGVSSGETVPANQRF